jgi:hypothetical protein
MSSPAEDSEQALRPSSFPEYHSAEPGGEARPHSVSSAGTKMGVPAPAYGPPREGHVLVNIRKFTGLPLRSLDELVLREMLSRRAAEFLRACVRARLSVVFAGPPDSGKATLLSCCAAELDPGLRVVVAEEVFETDIALPNVYLGRSRGKSRPSRKTVTSRLSPSAPTATRDTQTPNAPKRAEPGRAHTDGGREGGRRAGGAGR